jgi:hypothetical protein
MRLAVVTVTQTSTTVPRTNEFTRAYKDGHHGNFAEQSLGKLVFGPTVTYGPYYLHPEIGCHDYQAARNLAAAAGWVAADYWQTVVLMPDCGADYPEYIGQWPLYRDWWQHDFIQEGLRLGIQPIGVGLYRCKDTNGQWVMLAPAPQCTTSHYEDLGPTGSGEDAGLGHYPFAAKLSAGWVSLANLQTISADGDYTVLPLEYPTTGIQNLRVSTGTVPPLDIEFRRPSRYEIVRPASFFDGVFLRFGGGLLLPTPTSDWNFPQLPRGRSAYDPFHNVTITVLSADDSGAKVRFKFGGPVVGQLSARWPLHL